MQKVKIKIPLIEEEVLKSMMIDCSKKTANALSEMINMPINLSSTSLDILLINTLPEQMNPEDITTTVLYTPLKGSIKGVIVMSASLRNMLHMADIFLHKPKGYFKDLNDQNISVIKELTNILTDYYITALNSALHTNYRSSTPELSINPHRAIEEFGLGSVYADEIYVLVLKTEFAINQENIKETIFILFEKNEIKKILEKLMIIETAENKTNASAYV